MCLRRIGHPDLLSRSDVDMGKGCQLNPFDSNTYTYNANGTPTTKTMGCIKHTYTGRGQIFY